MTSNYKRDIWFELLADGQRVEYTYQEHDEKGTTCSASAQVGGEGIITLLDNVPGPLTQEEVQRKFHEEILPRTFKDARVVDDEQSV